MIELFIRETTNSTRYDEFEWSPLGEDFDARYDTRFGSPDRAWDTEMVSAVQAEGTVDQPGNVDALWTVEASIPLSSFQRSTVEKGAEWTFTVARYDYYNQPPSAEAELMMSTPGDPMHRWEA